MTLVIQVAGVLLLGALLGSLIRRSATSHRTVAGIVVIALAPAGLAFWNGLWSMGHTFVVQAGTWPSSLHVANAEPGSLFPADEGLLDEVDRVLPRNASVYLLCAKNSVGCSGEWISYRLSPRLFVTGPAQAQYVVVYGDSPKTVPATAHLPIVLDRYDGGVVRARP